MAVAAAHRAGGDTAGRNSFTAPQRCPTRCRTRPCFLSRTASRGYSRQYGVERVPRVPDDREAVAATIRRYSDAFDVVVTGGLGGTPDDVTAEAVAATFDRRTIENEVARADLERTLEALAGDSPSSDLDVDVAAQARLPAGSQPLVDHAGPCRRERPRPARHPRRDAADVRGGGPGVRRRPPVPDRPHGGAGGQPRRAARRNPAALRRAGGLLPRPGGRPQSAQVDRRRRGGARGRGGVAGRQCRTRRPVTGRRVAPPTVCRGLSVRVSA
ncbi:hypothetical protein BRD05_02225 [Halobacteriales archaeon QS_9_70_65]|nr:MAG: hypothetical protein BRD05_02225 [Halobacteriales archaeon QS_9_70_65]